MIDEITFWHRYHNVTDFVFYDDALLVDAENHALVIFEEIIRTGLKIRLHTPNGLHIRKIDDQTARLMHQAGMTTLRLGLETSDFQTRTHMDRKVNQSEFHRAVSSLKRAGFRGDQIGAYLLVGLPHQPVASRAGKRAEADIGPLHPHSPHRHVGSRLRGLALRPRLRSDFYQ